MSERLQTLLEGAFPDAKGVQVVDRTGGGDNPTSWNSAHASRGCSQANLRATGGNGYFFCFATGDDPAQQQEQQQGQQED